MKFITFLTSGVVTWASKSGKEQRRHIQAGTRMRLRVVERENDYELWDGKWSILVPRNVVRIETTSEQL